MSRYAIPVQDGTVVYGHDHAVGVYAQAFDSDGECTMDCDAAFDGLEGIALAYALLELRKAGADIPAGHIIAASRGLPF